MMTRFLLIALAILVGVGGGVVGHITPALALTNCYGSSAGTDQENQMTTIKRFAQTFTPAVPTEITSISFNIYGDPTATSFFHHQIVETSGGVPTSTVVAGSAIQIAVSGVPDATVGAGQAFKCGSIPAAQTFTYPSPVTLNVGTTYALSIHETGTGTFGRLGTYSGTGVGGASELAPGNGWQCSGGGGCPTWFLTESPGGSGINFDIMFSMETTLVDASVGGGQIDDHISRLRTYLRLGDVQGGLIFSTVVIGLLFTFMLIYGLPPLLTFGVNALLATAFTMAGIMPPWILMAVVAVGGISVVFMLATKSNSGGSSSEL